MPSTAASLMILIAGRSGTADDLALMEVNLRNLESVALTEFIELGTSPSSELGTSPHRRVACPSFAKRSRLGTAREHDL